MILATASPSNVIDVSLDCFYDANGSFDAEEYRLVLAHEFGHQFGIWDHVPRKCDDKAKTLPDGRRVCGTAIMNPDYDSDVPYLTPVDDLAFAVRDRQTNVLERRAAKPCTYEKKVR